MIHWCAEETAAVMGAASSLGIVWLWVRKYWHKVMERIRR